MFYTTLNRIYECAPFCQESWEKLLEHLGKKKADDDPLPLLVILELNGLDDAIRALRAIDDCPEVFPFAVRCVRKVQHLLRDDSICRGILNVVECWAVGERGEHRNEDAAWLASWAAAWAKFDEVIREAQREDFINTFCSTDASEVQI